MQSLREWSGQARFLLHKFFALMEPLLKGDQDEMDTLRGLSDACFRSSESALLLVAYGHCWDASIVLRSAIIGTLKFCYLLQEPQEPATFGQRHREYADHLRLIADLKDSRTAAELFAAASAVDDGRWASIRNLFHPDQELEEAAKGFPEEQRQALEERWGFTSLMRSLLQPGQESSPAMPGLAHSYLKGGHVGHADYMGVLLPQDEELRPDEERAALQLGDAVGIISDVLSLAIMRLQRGYRFVGEGPDDILRAREQVDALIRSFGPLYERQKFGWAAREPQTAHVSPTKLN